MARTNGPSLANQITHVSSRLRPNQPLLDTLSPLDRPTSQHFSMNHLSTMQEYLVSPGIPTITDAASMDSAITQRPPWVVKPIPTRHVRSESDWSVDKSNQAKGDPKRSLGYPGRASGLWRGP